VAYKVGFSSATYFNTCFHKFYGFTPGEAKSKMKIEVEEGHNALKNKKEGVSPDNPKNPKTKKGTAIKTVFLAAFPIVIVGIMFFLYNSTSTKSIETEENGNIISGKSIAVLPFKNWTGNPDLEYISDGMTDAVISRLAKISSIGKVLPFTSTLPYKETDKTVKEIASELGVKNLVQGNLQISGNQIKVNIQLIDGNSNEHLWTKEYTREWKTDEIFNIQAEVVEGIAINMNAAINKNELVEIKKTPTKNKQAYSYYLEGEFQRHKSNSQAYKNAIPLYEKAISLDSNFVDAYRSQATIWSFGGLVWGIYDEQMAWSNAKKLLEKALEIDPNNKEVEEELYTGYFYYDWNFAEVEKYYQQILQDSFFDNTPAINADYAIKTGRFQNVIDAMDELILTDPSIGILFFFKAQALAFLGKKEEAISILNATYSLHSDNWFYLRESTKFNFMVGEYEKSKIQLQKLLTQFPDYPPILMWLNANYAHMGGNLSKRNRHLAELHEEYDKNSSGSPAWFIAMYFCTLNDYEHAFDWLQKSYERHEVEMTWLREEPLLAPIRNDPRYIELYEKVGFSSIGLQIKAKTDKPY
jgi:TolB-like protein